MLSRGLYPVPAGLCLLQLSRTRCSLFSIVFFRLSFTWSKVNVNWCSARTHTHPRPPRRVCLVCPNSSPDFQSFSHTFAFGVLLSAPGGPATFPTGGGTAGFVPVVSSCYLSQFAFSPSPLHLCWSGNSVLLFCIFGDCLLWPDAET